MSTSTESGSGLKQLIGTDDATIDEKGRLLVGKKKRDRLGPDFVMYFGDSGCIYAYPQDTWDVLTSFALSHDMLNQGRQDYTRMLMGEAEDELNFDGQGRVVVPKRLRELAKLQEKVTLKGCGDRLEIWATEEFAKYEANSSEYGRDRRDKMSKAFREMKGE